MIDNQMGRRNMTLSELIAAQESVARDLEAEAKERKEEGKNQYTSLTVNLPQGKSKTRNPTVSEQMAKKIGVSEKTYRDNSQRGDSGRVLFIFIETNLKQRGVGNTNQLKMGRCIKALEKIYGIQRGNNQHTDRSGNDFQSSKSQENLAKEFGVDVRTLNNYKKLAETMPEVQKLIETGTVTPTTAREVIGELLYRKKH